MSTAVQSNLVSGGKVIATIAQTFGIPEFSIPENAGVYDNRSGKSTVAVSVKVPLTAVSLTLSGNVYGDLAKDGKITFRTSLPKGITASESVRDEWKRHVKMALASWPSYRKAALAAHARLTTTTKPTDPDAPLTFDPTAPIEPAKPEGETEMSFDPTESEPVTEPDTPEPVTPAQPEPAAARQSSRRGR